MVHNNRPSRLYNSRFLRFHFQQTTKFLSKKQNKTDTLQPSTCTRPIILLHFAHSLTLSVSFWNVLWPLLFLLHISIYKPNQQRGNNK